MPPSALKRSLEEHSRRAALAKKILEDASDISKVSRKYSEELVESENLSAFWTLEEIGRYELSCIFKKASEEERSSDANKEKISAVYGVPPPPREGASGGAKNPLTLDVTWQREARSSVKKNLQALRERERPTVLYNNTCLPARQVEGDIRLLVTTPEPIPNNFFGTSVGATAMDSSKEDVSASAIFPNDSNFYNYNNYVV